MSDSSVFKDTAKELPLKEAYQDLIHPTAEAVGKTLSLPFRAVNVLLSPVAKWVMQGEAKLSEISRLVAEEVKNIPPDKLVEPELYVAIPAMQAFSYSMDCEELKSMYAKLLARAIQVDEKSKVHPSYVEIIKQMSLLDARSLQFIQKGGHTAIALCSISWQEKSYPIWNGFKFFKFKRRGPFLYEHLVAAQEDGISDCDLTVSFENLNRLGLIRISDDLAVDREYYRCFETCNMFEMYKASKLMHPDSDKYEVALTASAALVTPLGKAFSAICLV